VSIGAYSASVFSHRCRNTRKAGGSYSKSDGNLRNEVFPHSKMYGTKVLHHMKILWIPRLARFRCLYFYRHNEPNFWSRTWLLSQKFILNIIKEYASVDVFFITLLCLWGSIGFAYISGNSFLSCKYIKRSLPSLIYSWAEAIATPTLYMSLY